MRRFRSPDTPLTLAYASWVYPGGQLPLFIVMATMYLPNPEPPGSPLHAYVVPLDEVKALPP
jgi:hypothetical protein